MDWFTSDPHFNHRNIIRLDNRPFQNLEEMHDVLITNLNNVVKPTDRLFILGDFSWGRLEKAIAIRKRIKCKRITLIFGNHERDLRKKEEFRNLFEGCYDIRQTQCGKHHFFLCHYPVESWNKIRHEAIHLHGHEHHVGRQMDNRLNVAMNLNDYKPLNYGQILSKLGL